MEDGTAAAGMNPSSCLRRTEKENLKPSQISLRLLAQKFLCLSLRSALGLMAKVVIKVGPITPNRESLWRIPKCEMVTKQPQPHLLT